MVRSVFKTNIDTDIMSFYFLFSAMKFELKYDVDFIYSDIVLIILVVIKSIFLWSILSFSIKK